MFNTTIVTRRFVVSRFEAVFFLVVLTALDILWLTVADERRVAKILIGVALSRSRTFVRFNFYFDIEVVADGIQIIDIYCHLD